MKKYLIYSIFLGVSFICFMNKTKALDQPFTPTGTMDFNIVNYNVSTETFSYTTRTLNYDFSKIIEDHGQDFPSGPLDNRKFFITIFTDNISQNKYIIELYISNNAQISTTCNAANTVQGDFQRYRYFTNINSKSNDILTATEIKIVSQYDSGSRSGFPSYGYYKSLPFKVNDYDSSNFTDLTNITIANYNDSNPDYFVPWGSSGSWSRFLIFSNYEGSVCNAYPSGNSLLNMELYTGYLGNLEPEATYTISDGTNYGKKINFQFNYFSSNSNATITNLSSGQVYNISDLSDNDSYTIDDISYDSVYYIEVYNDNVLVYSDTIDVNSEVRKSGKPYIDLTLDYSRLIAWLGFYNLKSSYHIYYSKNNGSFTEVALEEGNNQITVGFNNDQPELHNKNYTIRGQITDENGNILYDRGYNVTFFKNQPYFTFNSSYNNETGCNNLTITFHNSQNSDIISYSYDNVNYENFNNIKTNKLQVCASTSVYVKATRGNDYYYGYFYVNIEEFESSSNEQYQQNYDILSSFTNLFGNQDISFLGNFSLFFNALKRSFIFKYLMLIITGALILLIMKLVRR